MIGYNPFCLKGKTVLVTGASSVIGKQTAIECSKIGASVIITARNEARLTETLANMDATEGQQHKMILADLTVVSEVDNLVNEVS